MVPDVIIASCRPWMAWLGFCQMTWLFGLSAATGFARTAWELSCANND